MERKERRQSLEEEIRGFHSDLLGLLRERGRFFCDDGSESALLSTEFVKFSQDGSKRTRFQIRTENFLCNGRHEREIPDDEFLLLGFYGEAYLNIGRKKADILDKDLRHLRRAGEREIGFFKEFATMAVNENKIYPPPEKFLVL